MIDLGVEFKRMAEEFEISDKEVFTSVRTMLRRAWGDSVFKQDFLNKQSVLIDNTNTRSMKRFPKVRKYKCAICGGYFGSMEIELDHLVDENSLKSYEDINEFMLNIVLTSPDKLQILCKDKKTKKGMSHFGCHNIKTYASRYGISFDEAKATKQAIEIIKNKVDKDYCIKYSLGVPSKQAERRALIIEHLLSTNFNSKEKEDG